MGSVKRLQVRETWQQAYIVDLPALERVSVTYYDNRVPFVLSSWLLGSVKELYLNCPHLALPSLNALATGKLEELTLRVKKLTDH